jgi:hypothetical protein
MQPLTGLIDVDQSDLGGEYQAGLTLAPLVPDIP